MLFFCAFLLSFRFQKVKKPGILSLPCREGGNRDFARLTDESLESSRLSVSSPCGEEFAKSDAL